MENVIEEYTKEINKLGELINKMEIPDKLKQKGIKFVLLERGGKRPFQLEWQNKIIEFDNPELIEHLNKGGNYGVMGGGEKNLLIIDFDNEKVQEEVCQKLPATFTVRTGSGKLHKYFSSDRTESFKIFNENMDTIADVQGEGKQCVGAGSIHPNGTKYEVIEDLDIAFLPYSEIKALLMPYDKKVRKAKQEEYEKPKGIIQDDFLDTLKSYLSIEDVLNSFGIDTSKNPTECPFHSSKGGKCLGFNKETAHCFHCEGSWNIFSLVKDFQKCDFKEALNYLSNIAGLEEEFEKSKRRYIESLKENEENAKRNLAWNVLALAKEKKWGEATEMLVDYISEHNYFYTTKVDNQAETWVYKEGVYVPQGKSEIKVILRDIMQEHYSQYIYGLVIAKIEIDTFIEVDDFFKERHLDEIPLKNGIFNIYTRELKPYSPEKVFFNKMPVEYNPQSKCPLIEKFLKDVLANEEDIDVFFELGGFCLMNEYKYEKAFMFVGDGRNGKDKSLELLKRLNGVENCSGISLQELNDDFSKSELFGKKVNLAGDISNQELKVTAPFKALTGRSLIDAKRKFLTNISFVNKAKFIFACNQLPKVYDISRGFWERWVLLQFPYTFIDKETLEKERKKNPNLKLMDVDIIQKITTEEELSGLLNKFLEGLDRLQIQGKFSQTIGSEEIKNFWIRKSDSFSAFCMDYLQMDVYNFVTKKELRRRFNIYCKKHKIKGASDKAIKVTLEDMFGVTEDRKMVDGEQVWVWDAVKFKDTL